MKPRNLAEYRPRRRKTPEERFNSNIMPISESGCWIWMGSVNPGTGYGTFCVNYKHYMAHRFSWEFHNGPIPEGMIICHKCDVPSCVNPAHLFVGTYKDNTQDAWRKGRLRFGARNTSSIVNAEQVKTIRSEYEKGNITQKELSAIYGVKQQTISDIINKVNWVNV